MPYASGPPVGGAASATPTTSGAPATRRGFVSTPLTAPVVTTRRMGATAPGYLFTDPKDDGFNGLIMDDAGEPVWIEPTGANLTDLRVQSFEGAPVLSYWSGTSEAGHGEGTCTILDTHYRRVATVSAGNGLHADLHEFTITERGTALITAYSTVRADLSSIGGPKHGFIFDGHVQEIDVRSGAVLLDWSALDHIDVAETYLGLQQHEGHDGTRATRAFDPFHVNSADAAGDAIYVSARHTHAVYRIDRVSGAVRWRFGGRRSDIEVQPDARFAWQHDARHHPDGTLSIFDNHRYSNKTGQGVSSGMFFTIDERARTSRLVRRYADDHRVGTAMGSTQLLDGGGVLVGWGTDPAITEFAADGTVLYEAQLPTIAYRANRSPWTAQPHTVPDVAVRAGAGGRAVVSASWNGATTVARWRVLSGRRADAVTPATTAERTGFETSMLVAQAPFFAVQALSASGAVLATSATVSDRVAAA